MSGRHPAIVAPADALQALRRSRDTYGARRATHPMIPGVAFASETERDRAGDLLALALDGTIVDLRWHPAYTLSDRPSCRVTFDSFYVERTRLRRGRSTEVVGQQMWVEDVKPARGPISRDFRVRALWFRQLHPDIRVRVVKRGRGGAFDVASEF